MAPPPVFHGGSPPPPSSENSAQYIQQFLSNVLSQRGPSSLPYSEDSKWLIRQHIVTLIESYHGLQPKTAVYTHNDGRSVTLLQSEGTVPMLFQGMTYNIPIVIWLTETYPRSAPLVYVNPTRDMIIKRPHSFVNPSSGVVSVPYLSNWVYPSSNLVDLARDLCHHFARDPPLYSRRPPNSDPNSNPHSDFTSSNNSASARPAIPPRSYPQSPHGSSNGQISAAVEYPAEVFKRNAINKLVGSLNSDIWALRKTREGEMEDGFSAQAVLRQREELLAKGVGEMQGEKEALEQKLQIVLMNTDIMEGWLRENERKVGNMGNVDVDEAFQCHDVLSKQMLECTASDLAIEDVVYALDNVVQEGSIPFVQYLRNVRLLSREQFFHRATNSKVRAAQMGTQISSMAGRASPQAT